MSWWRPLCLLFPALVAGRLHAAPPPGLDLAGVIERARAQAPSARHARARAEETRATLTGARSLANPSLDLAAGPRWAGETTTDLEVSVAVPVDLTGARSKRTTLARAALSRDGSLAEDASRLAAGEAVTAFYRILHAERRRRLAEEWLTLAEELHRSAVERQRSGDLPQFAVNLADAEAGRAASTAAAEKARLARARGSLAVILGLPALPPVEGDLADRGLFDTLPPAAVHRADLRAARAAREAAAADRALAGTQRWPGIDLRLSYAREEGADLLLGGIGLTLPIFDRGQGDVARARARGRAATEELEAMTAAARAETDAAREAYVLASEALDILARRALPRAIENEALAREAYQAGKIDLAAFLLIRRDALDVRREHLDRLLDAALAGIDLWVARGAPTPQPPENRP